VKAREPGPAIEVAAASDGSLLYAVSGPPSALPAVRGRDLMACWAAARRLADAGQWGMVRRFRFMAEGGPIDLALADADACCWAEAVDARAGLHTRYGLSLCLRLLALVELLTRSARARALVAFDDGEAELHPSLVAAAASCPLGADARFSLLDPLAGADGACELLPAFAGSTV
jgi:hypothetical protein